MRRQKLGFRKSQISSRSMRPLFLLHFHNLQKLADQIAIRQAVADMHDDAAADASLLRAYWREQAA